MLQQEDSPEVQAATAESFSLHPSTAPRALDLAGQLLPKNFPLDLWLLRRLIPLNPDRVFGLLESIIVRSQDLGRRKWAVSVAQLPGRVCIAKITNDGLWLRGDYFQRMGLRPESVASYAAGGGYPHFDRNSQYARGYWSPSTTAIGESSSFASS